MTATPTAATSAAPRVHFLRKDLKRALTIAGKGVPRKSTLPILEHVLLSRSKGGRWTLRSTGLALYVKVVLPAPVQDDFSGEVSFCVPYRILQRLVNLLDGDTVSLEPGEDRVVIRSVNSTYTIPVNPGSDYITFPEMMDDLPQPRAKLKVSFLKRMRFRILPFASSDSLRPAMMEVFLAYDYEGHSSMVSTNGHVLSLLPILASDGMVDVPEAVGRGFTMHPSLFSVVPNLEDSDASIHVHEDGYITMACGDVVVTAASSGERYPQFENIVPSHYDHHGVIDGSLFPRLLARLKTTASEMTSQSRWTFCENEGSLLVESEDPGRDTLGVETVHYERIMGEDKLVMGFNLNYMNEVLRAFGKKPGRISMKMQSPNRAAVIEQHRGEDDPPTGFILLMPVILDLYH